MSIADNFPDIKPSLNLDFANTKSLDPRVDFDRSSTATYYDGETFAKAEENLFKYSQEIETANGWDERSIINVSTTKVAPDGTNTATEYEVEDVSDFHKLNPPLDSNIAANTTVTISAFFKVTGNQQYILFRARASSNAFQVFDVQNGTVSNGNGNVDNASINDVGNGWYRCAMTTTMSSDIFAITFYPHNSDNDNEDSYLGDSSNGFLIWGAQLEERSQVTAYTPTTDQPITNYIPVLKTAASNEPRFDHDPITGESKGLLIEEQRTNLVTYSESMSGISTARLQLYNSIAIAPDGNLTADGISVISSTTNNGYIDKNDAISLSSGQKATLSMYVKPLRDDEIELELYYYPISSVTFDLINKTIVDSSAQASNAKIEEVGNGWLRCSYVHTAISAESSDFLYYVRTANTVPQYTPEILVWGHQLEEGSFPTSYIKTEGSQVTRTADSASITGNNFSEWYRQDEGSIFVEMEGISDNYNSSNGSYSLLKVGPDPDSVARFIGFIELYRIGARNSQSVDGVFLASSTGNTEGKGALSYTFGPSGTLSGSVNGNLTVSENISANYGDGQISEQLKFGADLDRLGGNAPSSSGNVRWKKITYYPKRLPNAVLQALTKD